MLQAGVVGWLLLFVASAQHGLSGDEGAGIPAAAHRHRYKTEMPPLPARRFDQQEEGSSMRRMIAQFSAPIRDESRWQVFYDDVSGFPYYYDITTEQTQWENPWAASDGNEQAAETVAPLLESSWALYEKFRFRGVFDDLTSLRGRQRLPRAEPSTDAMRSIASMAGMQFDVAQARLEVALLKTETRSGTLRSLFDEASSVAGRESQDHLDTVGTISAVGDDAKRMDAINTDEAETEDELAMLLGLAGEEEAEEIEPVSGWGPPGTPHGAGSTNRLSYPPVDTRPGERIALAGGWNDLGNMWYARGEWELALECFRRSLYWNPEQTATLINLTSLLVKLGFERDAAVVWDYFVDVEGGTMGGWTAEREEALVASIESGLQLAKQLPGSQGRTLGEMRLDGVLPSPDDVQEAATKAIASSDLSAVLAAALQSPGKQQSATVNTGLDGSDSIKQSSSIRRTDGVPGRYSSLGQGDGVKSNSRPQLLPQAPLADLSTSAGASARMGDVGIAQRAPSVSLSRPKQQGLEEYARSVRQRLAQDAAATQVVLQRSWLWGVVPLSDDPSRPFKDIVGWMVGICLFAAAFVTAWNVCMLEKLVAGAVGVEGLHGKPARSPRKNRKNKIG